MPAPVSVAEKQLSDYSSIVGRPLVEEILGLAERLRGERILHLSATAFGSGVAEALHTLVPLMVDVGLRSEWQVIDGDDLNADAVSGRWDVVIVHDIGPVAVCSLAGENARHWVLSCHVDLVEAGREIVHRLLPFVNVYRDVVFPMAGFAPPGVTAQRHIIPPAIDPLAPKNMAFSSDDAVYICSQFGIDVERPLLCQVSRFDPWKDPLGVIDAYRIVKQSRPEVQLALIGSVAGDDPAAMEFYNATVAHADGDPDIHILNNYNNIGAIEVNAFQSHCDVAIQKSTREGFGLTASEAIWKAKPFIGGDVGGIPLQIADGETGFLVSSPEECAERARQILQDPGLGRALGRAGKENVRRRFLTPRLLRDWLELIDGILSRGGRR